MGVRRKLLARLRRRCPLRHSNGRPVQQHTITIDLEVPSLDTIAIASVGADGARSP